MTTSRRSILYLVGGFDIGGTERHLSLILPRLDRSEWDVHIRLLGSDGPLSTPLKEAGLDVQSLRSGTAINLPKFRALANLISKIVLVKDEIEQLKPDWIHCYLPEPSIIGWLANRITSGRRLLIISKRSQSVRPEAFVGEKWLEVRALKAADYLLGHSTVVNQELQRHGIPLNRIHLIHNGVDLKAFERAPDRAEIRAREGWPRQAVILIVLANLIPYKGHEDLLEALQHLKSFELQWITVFIGGGQPDRISSLKKISSTLGLEDRVIFAGRRTDIHALISSADIGVLPSHHEGFSNAILEYMAAGLPVVATDVGGNQDAVVDGETGFLVPPGNRPALTKALGRLLRNSELRARMGRSGKKRVDSYFNLYDCVRAYEHFYRSLPLSGSGL